jgi:exonuclease SbcD
VSTGRRPLRVLHTADVHLGTDGYGNLGHREAHQARSRRAFRLIVDRVLAEGVDLFLIAGDLFDHNLVPDETVAFARAELGRLRQPVVILPGNHDVLQPGAIYDRHDFSAGAAHVHVIREPDGQVVDLPELDAAVWGRAMAEHCFEFSPLARLPARPERRWCLAMGHGFYHGPRQRPERSSPIFADEIESSGWDYLALGHHHLRTDVSQGRVRACYPGAPLVAWDHPDPDGTVLLVDLAEDAGVRVSPRPIV